MSEQPTLYDQLPAEILSQLRLYQERHHLENLDAAVVHILQDYLTSTVPLMEQYEDVERRLNALGREVVQLRQQMPQNYDRLREQLAAVRLSHSGLLHNLRDRIAIVEQHLQINDDNEDTSGQPMGDRGMSDPSPSPNP
ncbi:hypothetical protein L3556_08200 [Candidatus Synechococcus calcipolaris G9]|uniref:Uncharacterized protein n=1 Tax=Candidatus Synechococcus calcipolaris G9 TaxID=1497997 RepID=A0ABT6EZ97_9SYNE|nr:hypothetical protein [Candidatus Synechococcus calcipolaris]MDG2990907.1 hypothetical protein [Candidatus Synechococcus calcipolaris G9]